MINSKYPDENFDRNFIEISLKVIFQQKLLEIHWNFVTISQKIIFSIKIAESHCN